MIHIYSQYFNFHISNNQLYNIQLDFIGMIYLCDVYNTPHVYNDTTYFFADLKQGFSISSLAQHIHIRVRVRVSIDI